MSSLHTDFCLHITAFIWSRFRINGGCDWSTGDAHPSWVPHVNFGISRGRVIFHSFSNYEIDHCLIYFIYFYFRSYYIYILQYISIYVSSKWWKRIFVWSCTNSQPYFIGFEICEFLALDDEGNSLIDLTHFRRRANTIAYNDRFVSTLSYGNSKWFNL